MRGRQSWFRAGQRLWQSIRPVQPSRGAGPSPRAERVLPAHSKEIRRSRGASIVGACRSYQRADVSSPFKSGDPATAGCTLYASCGSGGHPACRRAGRPARRKNAPLPGKVELFASPVETRALDPAARCRQPRQAGRPPSPRLWRTGPPLQKSRPVPAAAIETDKCV